MRIAAMAVALLVPTAAHPQPPAPGPVPAQRAVLLRASGSNVHAGHLAAATDVFRSQLERTGKFQVTIVASPSGSDEPTPAQAGEAARTAGTDVAITLRIARLGSSAMVRTATHRPDGTIVHLDELTAASPEDLERVLQRLAEGAASGRPARELATIDTVTEREADAYLKYTATNVFGVRVGGQYVMNRVDPNDRSSTPGGFGVFWLYDARRYLADVVIDWFGGDRDSIFSLGIGAYYPFSQGNETPYVGGGVAWATVDHGGNGARGLVMRAGGGFLFGRLSNVQLRADAGYAVNLFAERRRSVLPVAPFTTTEESRAAHGPYLTLGIGF